MTGGGFGGCTVTLVEREFTEKAIETIKNGYEGTATFYVCQPSEGARSFTPYTNYLLGQMNEMKE